MSDVISLQEWRERAERLSSLKSPSPQNIKSEIHGLTLIEDPAEAAFALHMATMLTVLYRIWRKPIGIKSDFARMAAFYVAILACEGMITTAIDDDVFGTTWLITEKGLIMKGELDEYIKSLIERHDDTSGPDNTA
jgi:hypothetical protein